MPGAERCFKSLIIKGLFIVCSILVAGCEAEKQKSQAKAPPPAVIVESVRLTDLNSVDTFTGRIEAMDSVQVRARISGYLQKRPFKEGSEVKKGDLLFEIERKPFEIALSQSESALASANAAATNAKQNFDRKETLARKNISSQASLDDARTALTQATAEIRVRESAVERAKLDLSYTRLMAPMDGLIGRAAYSVGAYLTPQSNSLATLVRQDPMYVTFPVPQEILLEVRKAGRGADSVFVELILADGTTYDQKGKIEFADVQTTASTDSVLVRATIPNPKRLLIDRQIVDVRVIRKKPDSKLVMSQSALLIDQAGSYALKVDDANKIVMQRIKSGERRGSLVVINEGLAAGERVVVSGHQKSQPGKVVSPQTAEAANDKNGSKAKDKKDK